MDVGRHKRQFIVDEKSIPTTVILDIQEYRNINQGQSFFPFFKACKKILKSETPFQVGTERYGKVEYRAETCQKTLPEKG